MRAPVIWNWKWPLFHCCWSWLQSKFALRIGVHHKCSLMPPLYGERSFRVRVEGSPSYLSSPGQTNFWYISLHTWLTVYVRNKKIGLARKVTPITGLPFCDGRVLSKAYFSPYKCLGSPSWVNRIIGKTIRACMSTVLDNQSMGKCCWFGQRGQLFHHFFRIKQGVIPYINVLAYKYYEEQIEIFI